MAEGKPAPARVKLLLFDLDGTVLRATRGAAPFAAAFAEVFGVAAPWNGVRFDGKTDPMILGELLAHAGVDRALDQPLLARFESCLARHFEASLRDGTTEVHAVHGVPALLEALSRDPDYALAVLTGNLERTGWLKLRAAGLADYFETGAFGSDHAVRAELPDVARARLRARHDLDVPRRDCVIVGDTPLDRAAAAACGIPCVLVASGRTPYDELAALGAEAVFRDWRDPGAILRALEAL